MVAREVTIAAMVALALAGISYRAIALDRGRRSVVLAALVAMILMSPLLVSIDPPFGRFLASVFAVALVAKLHDLRIGADLGYRPGWGTFLASLPNLSSLVLRKLDEEPRPGQRQILIRLAGATLRFVAGLLILIVIFRIDWRRFPFVLEHCAKVLAFFLTLVPAAAVGASLLRLLGGRAREPMDNPFASRTPADFWRRYNRPVQQFFYEDLFKPLGGLRSPVRATLLTFVVSAVIHEYVFDIAVGRLQGYQTMFFLLQGCAVAATAGIKPRGRRAIPWIAGTLAFNLATSALFFASLDEVLPFYADRSPGEPHPSASIDRREASDSALAISGSGQRLERDEPERKAAPGGLGRPILVGPREAVARGAWRSGGDRQRRRRERGLRGPEVVVG
jgi:hypothetical protein